MNNEIILGVLMFTAVVLSLVAIIIVARAQLVSSGAVTIFINDDPEKAITVAAGDKLLQTLSAQGIFLASACGVVALLKTVAALCWPRKKATSPCVKQKMAGVYPARLQ
jgi:Na+-transporting NADH:ubiquinone oxidoreductase subunit NqrF